MYAALPIISNTDCKQWYLDVGNWETDFKASQVSIIKFSRLQAVNITSYSSRFSSRFYQLTCALGCRAEVGTGARVTLGEASSPRPGSVSSWV